MLNSKLIAFCALLGLLLSSGCDAQRPQAVSQTAKVSPFVEPTLIGKIVDSETRRPIQGAYVYGHYSTSTGTLAGGRKFNEAVKSFLVETDANGEFRLEGWVRSDQQIESVAGDRFPYIGIYKPGYDMRFDRLNTIKQWRPKTDDPNAHPSVSNGVHDWRAYPNLLKRAYDESARYFALDISSSPMLNIGECGWEIYAPLLLAQHNELKDWYRRNLPKESVDQNGYIKGTAQKPSQFRLISFMFETSVDRLIKDYAITSLNSKCADPRKLFEGKK